jgi:hypothetical protein
VLGALGTPGAVLAHGDDDHGGRRIRWDLVNILTPCVSPGGHASARSQDGARITITGSGTFPSISGRLRRLCPQQACRRPATASTAPALSITQVRGPSQSCPSRPSRQSEFCPAQAA